MQVQVYILLVLYCSTKMHYGRDGCSCLCYNGSVERNLSDKSDTFGYGSYKKQIIIYIRDLTFSETLVHGFLSSFSLVNICGHSSVGTIQ